MASLNLATLSVDIQATGVNETQRDINNLTGTMQNTQGTANSFSGAFTNLGTNMRNTIGQTQIFGTSLSSIGSAFTSAGGMATLMQGAVMGLTSALVQMATQAIQKAIAGLGQFIKQGIELASDLTEIQNVLDAAFGDNADKVNEWAITTASAFGLTEIQAKQFASTTGAILSGMSITGDQALTMSTQIAQLTGDMASFYNLDHEEAFNKIKSGLTGETEPLKSLGIVMTETNLAAFALAEGMEKTYAQMSASEKTILRYNYLINQTSLAHGDFASTADSYANASQQLTNQLEASSATLGSGLLPVLSKMKSAISGTLKNLEPVFSIIGKLLGGMLQTLYTLLEPCIMILQVLLKVLEPILEFINKILDGFLKLLNKIGSGLTDIVGWFAEKLGLMQDTVAETAEYTTEKITEETEKALGFVDSAIDKWMDEQMEKYRETLEERYGTDSLANNIKIEKMMQNHEAVLNRTADSTRKAYENAETAKQNAINNTNEAIEKQISLSKKQVSSGGSYTNGIRQYATGTPYHTGGLAMVGEFGRELVNLPRGTQVATNRQTENILSGGARGGDTYIVENVSINASSIQDISDMKTMFNGYTQNSRMGGGK